MVNFNDIEKKLQNYQEGSDYNVSYESDGAKRTYTIYPGRALEFIRQTVTNSPMPPGVLRPIIERNSIIKYMVEEKDGLIICQRINTIFSKENMKGVEEKKNLAESNQRSSIARQQNDQICLCQQVRKSCTWDSNRCLKCGNVFREVVSGESSARDNMFRHQLLDLGKEDYSKEEFLRNKRGLERTEKIIEESIRPAKEDLARINREFGDDGLSSSFSHQASSYSEPQFRFVEINEDSKNVDTKEKTARFFQQQQQQQQHPIANQSATIPIAYHSHKVEVFNQDKSLKTTLAIGGAMTLVSGVGLLIYLFRKKHTKGNWYATNN